MSLRAEAIEYYKRRKEKYPQEETVYDILLHKQYFDSIPDDVFHKLPRNKRWYFYINIPGKEHIDLHKEYAFLWNYPEDIKPDWAEAMEECKILLREDGFEV